MKQNNASTAPGKPHRKLSMNPPARRFTIRDGSAHGSMSGRSGINARKPHIKTSLQQPTRKVGEYNNDDFLFNPGETDFPQKSNCALISITLAAEFVMVGILILSAILLHQNRLMPSFWALKAVEGITGVVFTLLIFGTAWKKQHNWLKKKEEQLDISLSGKAIFSRFKKQSIIESASGNTKETTTETGVQIGGKLHGALRYPLSGVSAGRD